MKFRIIILLIIIGNILTINATEIEELEQRFNSFSGKYSDNEILLNFDIKEEVLCDSMIVYRSYNPIEIPVDLYKLPISRYVTYSANSYTDINLSDNIDYYYRLVGYLEGEAWAISNNLMISVPDKNLEISDLSYKDVHFSRNILFQWGRILFLENLCVIESPVRKVFIKLYIY